MAVPAGTEVVVKDAIVFLVASGVVVPLFRKLRIPVIIGFVIAGIALGPFGLGSLAETVPWITYLTLEDTEAIAPFAELGVLFLLFLLGLELSFQRLWQLRRIVFGAGALQVGFSAGAIGLATYYLGLSPIVAAVVGLALALSSTAIVMQLMIEDRRVATPVGRVSLGVLLFQDIMVAPILIFVAFASVTGGGGLFEQITRALIEGVVAVVIIVLIGRYALKHVFHMAAQAGGRDFLMALTLLSIIGAAVITASAGLSLALGAFMAGLLLGETEFKHQTEVDLEPFKGLLLGLFFMTVGMGLDFSVIAEQWQQVLLGLAGLLVLKWVIAYIACRVGGADNAPSLEAAFLLAPAGEFAFIILATAIASQIIGAEQSALIAAIAGSSMILTPVFGRVGAAIAKAVSKSDGSPTTIEDFSEHRGHVIIAGFGRVGRSIAGILEAEQAEFIALDMSAARVASGRRDGFRVFVGDAARPEILRRLGGETAAHFVVTVDNPQSAVRMVKTMRALCPDAAVLARARDADHASELKEAGASFVIPDAIEAGLQLAGRSLLEFGYDGETTRDRIEVAREDAYAMASDD